MSGKENLKKGGKRRLRKNEETSRAIMKQHGPDFANRLEIILFR
jgi:hypothetical protein